MEIKVAHFRRLGGTDGELLAIEGMYETAQSGHLLGFHVSPDNEVIIAYDKDIPVALVVFAEYEDCGELWIHLGYCRQKYRRQGHYRACITKLKELAAKRNFNQINTATHPDNMPAIESIEARGGKLQYLGFVFPVC